MKVLAYIIMIVGIGNNGFKRQPPQLGKRNLSKTHLDRHGRCACNVSGALAVGGIAEKNMED